MASVDFLQARNYLKKGEIVHKTDDTPVALRLRYTGSGTITSVTTTTGTSIVAITSDGGTETWDFATYTTVGLLADKINASAYWECIVLDALRADATATQFVDGVISSSTFEGITYYDVKVDVSAAIKYAARLTYDKHTATSGMTKPSGSHRVSIKEIKYYVNLNAATADSVQVWEIDGTTETKVYSAASVDATETSVTWASGNGVITANDGNDLVVKVKDSTSITDNVLNHVTIVGELE